MQGSMSQNLLGLSLLLLLPMADGALIGLQHGGMSRTAPCEGRRRASSVSLCQGQKRVIANILSELDEAVAASAADRAERLKTTQEKLAAEQAAAQATKSRKILFLGRQLVKDPTPSKGKKVMREFLGRLFSYSCCPETEAKEEEERER